MSFPVSEKLVSMAPTPSKLFNKALYHMQTLYLFTASDFSSFALPTTLFGICSALSGPLLTTNTSPSILSRIPSALAVIWINLLVFNIANQRTPFAIQEDAINKPHRPIPSGRIMSDQSRQLLLILIPITLVLGYVMGVYQETVLLFVFQHIYNDLRGCDTHFLVRNALIAIGYGLYSAISLSILTGPTHCLNKDGYVWVGVVTGVMFCTQHICDIKDAEGDKLRGRKSAPIVLGDLVCRWSVAVPVMVCSWTCPVWFGLGWGSCVATMGMGGLVAGRTLVLRDLDSDKLTWKLWALWTCSLFMLPLVKNPAVLCGLWEGVLELRYIEKGFISGLDVAAVSGIAAVVEGRRMWALMRGGGNETARVPVITVNGVVA